MAQAVKMYDVVCSYLQSIGFKEILYTEYNVIIREIDQGNKVAAIKWLREYARRNTIDSMEFLQEFHHDGNCNNNFLLFLQALNVRMEDNSILGLKAAKEIIDVLFDLHRQGILNNDFTINPE